MADFDLIEQLREEHRQKGTLDTNDIAYLFICIAELKYRVDHQHDE